MVSFGFPPSSHLSSSVCMDAAELELIINACVDTGESLASAGDGACSNLCSTCSSLARTDWLRVSSYRWKHSLMGTWRRNEKDWRDRRRQGLRTRKLESQINDQVRLRLATLFVNNADSRELFRNRSMTGKEIYDLAWSPSGLQILAGSVDHTATIYDVATGASHSLLTI